MASPARPTLKRITAAPQPIELLGDDLLAEILLRVPTLSDVGRAAASCAAFRRVAADRDFLRRLHSVHPAPLVGIVMTLGSLIRPAELPHSSARYARAFAERADLSFGTWLPLDARDGRVLLELATTSGGFSFMVCDPLSRRYAQLPQIPGNLVLHYHRMGPFFVPASDEEAETSFRVVCGMQDPAKRLVAFVFSSSTGQWSSLPVGASVQHPAMLIPIGGYAYGCFYWKVGGTDEVIVFDTRTLEFSSVHIPFSPDIQQHYNLVIVEAGEGKLGVFTIDNHVVSAVAHLIYAVQEIDEDGSSRWRIERRVRLPSLNGFRLEHATDRYLLLRGGPGNPPPGFGVHGFWTEYFSFELGSLKLEKICGMRSRSMYVLDAKVYASFPPSLCLPTI